MLYQTLYYPDNPTYEYQKRSSGWVRRKKGSSESWYPVASTSNQVLNDYFSGKKIGYQYSITAKVGAIVILLVGSYFLYKRWNFKN